MPPLTPDQQQALLMYLLMGGMGSFSPSMSPAQLGASYGQIPAELDDEGNMLPWGLDQENMASTYANKRNDLMGDYMTAAQAGPGAFAAGAFDPIVTKEELVRRPGQEKMAFYLSRPGTPEWFIANEIDEGGTSTSALAKMAQIVNGEPKTENDAQLQAQLRMSLPTVKAKDATGAEVETFDFSGLSKMASELEGLIVSDPVGNYVMTDENGNEIHYNREVEDSQATQVFRQLGLPLPTEQYNVGDVVGGDFVRKQQGLKSREAEFYGENSRDPRGQQSRAKARINRLPERRRGYRDTPAVNPPGVGGMQRAMTDYAARIPEYEQGQNELARQRESLYDEDWARNVGRFSVMQQQGRTPLNDALMQRRMAMMAMGLQGGGYLPGM